MDRTDQVSEHYKGDRGAAYAAIQAPGDHPGLALNANYFAPYIEREHRVLDFGCGSGGMLPHLAKLAAEVEGLEVNDAARAVALQRGFTVYAGVDELPADARYDIIVSNHVLEHVPNVCEVLCALRRHLVPGGQFVAKLPIDDIRNRHQRQWSKDDVNRHLQTWTPRHFANVLFESGFEVERSTVITSAWHPKLFPFMRFGLHRTAFWAFAVLKNRRQLFAVGRNPA